VVVSFPASPSALGALEAALGPGFDVIDIRTAPVESDLVVCRPCSPGAIRMVKRTFPGAEVVVVGPVDSSGWVARMRTAGVDVHVADASVAQLASVIRCRLRPGVAEATLVCHRRPAA